MTEHRILVCGGRDYSDKARLFAVLDHYHAESGGFAVVIEGEARGADTLAREWAESRNIPVLKFPADWDRDGYAAGPIRNAQMIAEGKPTVVIAFAGGRGTRNMITQARENWIPVLVIES